MTVEELCQELGLHEMPINGKIPITKKCWRDGYNKALSDVVSELNKKGALALQDSHLAELKGL